TADLLDQVEELGSFLPYEGLAEEITQPADVGAQLAAGRGGLVVGTAHRCGSLQCGSSSGGNPAGCRGGGCRIRAGASGKETSADRAVRPSSRIGVDGDAQAPGLLPPH